MQPIVSGQIVRTYTQTIQARPDEVFPLLCPVREAEWLDGWAETYELIHSASGVAEEGCVFQTWSPDWPTTTWMVTRHDATTREVEFVRVTEGLFATRLRLGVQAARERRSTVSIEYIHTPLNEAGRAFLDTHYHEAAFQEDMAWWERSMNHWLDRGEILRAAEGVS